MNRIQHIRRLAGALGGLAGALLALAAAASPALAGPVPPHTPPGWQLKHHLLPPGHWTGPVYNVPAHTVVTGGMPSWQIALIAAGAALAAATVAVLLDRARPARRKTTTAAA